METHLSFNERLQGAMWGIFIGDALAMPVHWYYDTLALKYENAPEEGLIANTMCGGDNCGRGTVLGALLGARNGMRCWPDRWVEGLLEPPPSVTLPSNYGGG